MWNLRSALIEAFCVLRENSSAISNSWSFCISEGISRQFVQSHSLNRSVGKRDSLGIRVRLMFGPLKYILLLNLAQSKAPSNSCKAAGCVTSSVFTCWETENTTLWYKHTNIWCGSCRNFHGNVFLSCTLTSFLSRWVSPGKHVPIPSVNLEISPGLKHLKHLR